MSLLVFGKIQCKTSQGHRNVTGLWEHNYTTLLQNQLFVILQLNSIQVPQLETWTENLCMNYIFFFLIETK